MLKTTAAIAAVTAVAGAANAFVLTSVIANPNNELGTLIEVQDGVINDLFVSGFAQAGFGPGSEFAADTYFGLGAGPTDFTFRPPITSVIQPTQGGTQIGFSGLAAPNGVLTESSNVDGVGDAVFIGRIATATGTGITGDLVLSINDTKIYSMNLDGSAGRLFDTSTTSFPLPSQTGTAEDAALYSLEVVVGTEVNPTFGQPDSGATINTFDIYVVREIPAPGAAGLLAVAGVAAARRRRA